MTVIPPNLAVLAVLGHFSNQPYPWLWALHRRMR